MKKYGLKSTLILLCILMTVAFAGCDTKEEAAEMIVGEWQLVSEKEYITKYIFWENGNLTESVILFGSDGNEMAVSMSDLVDMHYRVTDKNVLEVYGTALGYDGLTEPEKIRLEFIGDDTMMLDGDTYVRVKQQGTSDSQTS